MQSAQQFVLQKEAETQQFVFDEMSNVKTELVDVIKKLDKKVEVLEFTKVLKTKASIGDVEELSESIRKLERNLPDIEDMRRALVNKVDAIELQKWNMQRAKQGVSNDMEEFIEDRLRVERNKTKEYFSDLEKLITSKATKVEKN